MNFANLPVLWTLLGVAAIAGVLYALQRLRVRHQPVEIETTLFWRQAIEESRARVLVQRFRHPWAYALILLIAALLWFGVAGLRRAGGDGREHVVLLDGSASMQQGDRFAEAAQAAIDHTASLPEDSRTVVLCAGRSHTLLRPGEDAMLLQRRLAELQPQACANSVGDELLRQIQGRGSSPLTITAVGDVALTADERALLPENVELQQLSIGARDASNRGIVALGVRPAPDRWDAVDVTIDVVGDGDAPKLTLDGANVDQAPTTDPAVPGRYRYRFPARGQQLLALLASDGAISADNHASFVLPDRRPIAVAIGPGVPDAVRQVVEADPGLLAKEDGARAAIRVAGSGFAAQLPAIELSDPSTADNAFLVFHPEDLDPTAVLRELYTGLGLDEIDAMATAKALGRTITMGAKPAAQKSLWVWGQLLRDDYDFVDSRSFPLFIGLGVRWLADFEEGPVRVAAGEPIAVADAAVNSDRGDSRSFDASFVPAVAGRYTPARGPAFAASLLDPFTSGVPLADAASIESVERSAAAGLDLLTYLLLLALLLLGAEWVLFRTSRIP